MSFSFSSLDRHYECVRIDDRMCVLMIVAVSGTSAAITSGEVDSDSHAAGTMGYAAGAVFAFSMADCDVVGDLPTTDGNNVYVSGENRCTGNFATSIAVKVRKNDGFPWGWNDKGSWGSNSSGGSALLTASTSWNCNGSGTDQYRTKAEGRDIHYDIETVQGPKKSLTC